MLKPGPGFRSLDARGRFGDLKRSSLRSTGTNGVNWRSGSSHSLAGAGDGDISDLTNLRRVLKDDFDGLLRRQQKALTLELEKWMTRQEAVLQGLQLRAPHAAQGAPYAAQGAPYAAQGLAIDRTPVSEPGTPPDLDLDDEDEDDGKRVPEPHHDNNGEVEVDSTEDMDEQVVQSQKDGTTAGTRGGAFGRHSGSSADQTPPGSARKSQTEEGLAPRKSTSDLQMEGFAAPRKSVSDLQMEGFAPRSSVLQMDDGQRLKSTVTSASGSTVRCRSMREEDELRIKEARQASVHTRKSREPKQIKMRTGVQARIEELVNSRQFESFFCTLIVLSTIAFGVEVEYIANTRVQESPVIFVIVGETFIILFCGELLLRIAAQGCRFFYGSEVGWNLFDALLVGVSVMDSVLNYIHRFGGAEGGAEKLTFFRMVRILRTVRVFRVFRIMRFFRSLRILVFSVLNTLKSLFWTMLLLTLILYLFGMLFTQAVVDYLIHDAGPHDSQPEIAAMVRYYSSLLTSILTLFKTITGGVTWQEVLEPLAYLHWVWLCFFILYVAFTSFAVLNVVTGVFCETAISGAQEERDEAVSKHLDDKSKLINQLREIFGDLDEDESGAITIEEFEDSLHDERLSAYFASMDLHVSEAWNLFKLLDTDGSHIIDLDEFVTGCLRLRGNAKSIDIAMLSYESRWMIERFAAFTLSVDEQFDILRGELQTAASQKPDSMRQEDARASVTQATEVQRYNSVTVNKPSSWQEKMPASTPREESRRDEEIDSI